MSNNFNNALHQASCDEFAWLDTFKNPYDNHIFSKEFEDRMHDICHQPEYSYVSIGSHRLRKKFVLILVAILAILISGCAIAHYYIVWTETQNDDYGTLDVEFEVDEKLPQIGINLIYPLVPKDYKEFDINKNESTLMIEYRNTSNEIIIYSQRIGFDGMGSVSINNETPVFEEVTINGYKGYHSENDGVNFYIWSDGYCLYSLQGTCSNDTLLEIIKSIKISE